MRYLNIALIGISVCAFLGCCRASDRAEKEAWQKAEAVLAEIHDPVFPDLQICATDFGLEEGVEVYGQAITKAIEACASQGGGTVVVPKGTYCTGPIELKSNVCLHFEDSTVLYFSNDPEDYLPQVITRWEGWDCYNFRPLIYAYGQKNIAITGHAVLDGQASETKWWPWKGKAAYGWKPGMVCQEWNGDKVAGRNRLAAFEAAETPVEERVMQPEDCLRPPFIQPYLCQNVLIQDITVMHSPFWLLHPLLCENVTVRGVTMESHGPNNDGCDPESCHNVLIENCYFNTGDDCIAIKSGRNKDGFRWHTPTRNVIVRNCQMKDGHGGVVIGSEISGGCKWVWAENCRMDSPNLDRIIRLKTNPLRGGEISHLYVRNLEVGVCREAIMRVELKYEGVTSGPNMPSLSDIIISGVNSSGSRYGVWIDGFEDVTNVRDVLLKDCRFDQVKDGNRIVGAENVCFEKVFLNGEKAISVK